LEATPGQKNVAHLAAVDKSKICASALHKKLPLIKMFVKATDKERGEFDYLRQIFPKISEAKMKEGIFVGSQVQ